MKFRMRVIYETLPSKLEFRGNGFSDSRTLLGGRKRNFSIFIPIRIIALFGMDVMYVY